MPRLIDKETGALLGIVCEEDIDKLVEQLEEEDSRDQDYFIDDATIVMLEESGASPALVTMLRKAVGDSEGIEIRYEK